MAANNIIYLILVLILWWCIFDHLVILLDAANQILMSPGFAERCISSVLACNMECFLSLAGFTVPGIKGCIQEQHHPPLTITVSDLVGKKKIPLEFFEIICPNSNLRNIPTKTHINDSIELKDRTAILPLWVIYSPEQTIKGITGLARIIDPD